MLTRALIIVGFALSLAACATPIKDPDISKAQQLSQQICGYVPTAASIAKLASTFVGLEGTINLAENIANAVCDALKVRPLSEGPLVVRGVRVEGRYSGRR